MLFILSSVFLIGVSLPFAMPQDIVFRPDPPSFRPDYTFSNVTNLFYKEHSVTRNFSDALNLCLVEGAELALPASALELEHLVKLIPDSSKDYYWIGLNDLTTRRGDFLTLNGTSASEIFTNWADHEPNNSGGDEFCVDMGKAGTYNDVTCKHKRKFFCTRDIQDRTKYNTQCETPDRAYFYESEAKKCYKLHKTPKSWHDAFFVCHHELASLAIANSPQEMKIFIDNMVRYPEHTLRGNFNRKVALLGFNELATPGEFLTITGETLNQAGYDDWADNQPDHWEDNEHCGSMYRDGKLNDIGCHVKAMFYCEKELLGDGTLVVPRNSFDEEKKSKKGGRYT